MKLKKRFDKSKETVIQFACSYCYCGSACACDSFSQTSLHTSRYNASDRTSTAAYVRVGA